ncbi:NAD(P)H-dependent oxidoreductase [Persicobacter sp. CCB-QB2]|uniref:NAD(P)H-dependent oxidoreductase n=1 Tax=Persicobacter sp. CCB-QB2 TaxID=1561025 RepID=UPI000AF1D5B5|nr:NAD(P)H-dependent oxidoreductase [Persicobacter sp. CCB-QB2]
MELIENLNWRYATKKFDATKKISSQDLDTILEAVRLSASSYGLQLYKILVIEDAELRAKLQPAAWNQSQIVDASQLIVFCNYSSVKAEHIDEYLRLKADTQGMKLEDLKAYGDFMKSKLGEFSPEAQGVWTARQTYIALGYLLNACAALRIDACPMEGFEPEKFNEILGLQERGFMLP